MVPGACCVRGTIGCIRPPRDQVCIGVAAGTAGGGRHRSRRHNPLSRGRRCLLARDAVHEDPSAVGVSLSGHGCRIMLAIASSSSGGGAASNLRTIDVNRWNIADAELTRPWTAWSNRSSPPPSSANASGWSDTAAVMAGANSGNNPIRQSSSPHANDRSNSGPKASS